MGAASRSSSECPTAHLAATEIPEAPEGGTLYRTLFLSALLLFAVTFAANTAAELVCQHLRQKYARL